MQYRNNNDNHHHNNDVDVIDYIDPVFQHVGFIYCEYIKPFI
jgi:hypothetical protein